MSRPDEGLIHQWLDGECTPEESARLEQLVATDPEWAAAVAEARGLIAASSRIVQSLDAVPRAMPAGSVAAPKVATARAPRGFATKPWMRIAAAVVLVAGTAYVLREQTAEPFTPVATVDMPAPTAPPAMTAEEMSRVEPPSTVPPMGPVRTADRVIGESERGATQSAPAPVLSPEVDARKAVPELPAAPPPPSPAIAPQVSRSSEDARSRTANVEVQRRARLTAEAPRGAVARATAAGSAAPAAPDAPAVLEGCWRVSAPPQLVGILERPQLRRQSGDTLVLITSIGDLKAVRENDRLRGELQAVLESCPSTP